MFNWLRSLFKTKSNAICSSCGRSLYLNGYRPIPYMCYSCFIKPKAMDTASPYHMRDPAVTALLETQGHVYDALLYATAGTDWVVSEPPLIQYEEEFALPDFLNDKFKDIDTTGTGDQGGGGDFSGGGASDEW